MTYKLSAVALATALGLGLCAGTGLAQNRVLRHIDELAVQLERDVKTVHKELHHHFRDNRQFRHLEADVREMERLARHIHDVAHKPGAVRHLRHDIRELDRLQAHVRDRVRGMARGRRIDGETFRHLMGSLARVDRTVEHLQADLRELDGPDRGRDRDRDRGRRGVILLPSWLR